MTSSSEEMLIYTLADDVLGVGLPCPRTLFVFVDSEQKYLEFAAEGEILSKHKVDTILSLLGNLIFVRAEDADFSKLSGRASFVASSRGRLKAKIAAQVYIGENLSKDMETCLKGIYLELLDPHSNIPLSELSETLTELSDSLLTSLVPEIKDLKAGLLKHLPSLNYMNHAAAISSLVLLIAIANDFKSKTSFKQLSLATLLMDVGLGDLEEHWMDTYYRDRKELPSYIWDRIKAHPLKSQQSIAYLPITTDLLSQLILTHHELNNGQGYHRGLQSGSTLTLARILSLAVDMYEHIKGNELRGSPIALWDIVRILSERGVEPHKRRHNQRIVENLIAYLGHDLLKVA